MTKKIVYVYDNKDYLVIDAIKPTDQIKTLTSKLGINPDSVFSRILYPTTFHHFKRTDPNDSYSPDIIPKCTTLRKLKKLINKANTPLIIGYEFSTSGDRLWSKLNEKYALKVLNPEES